ncbi:hypothetical protein BV22DRAFT_1057011 [Leucogyrophana mollusca]|uniref:Uncharacterized protein n=1 Tax=Leucogyrophana mollusca TaxID=85980 RepID=A0ACB8BWT8_9AGAM|nr:hypothetical protein BV22DRAFT_1057011 [Leucogyrophana mollusca]
MSLLTNRAVIAVSYARGPQYSVSLSLQKSRPIFSRALSTGASSSIVPFSSFHVYKVLRMRVQPLLRSFTCFGVFSLVHAFSVTVVSGPTQCDDLTVSWTGGQPPFEILLTPVYNYPRNISVPSSSFSNNAGSYTIPQLPFANKTRFLLTMSDATGFGTGGTSNVLTVGDPVGNNNCNTTNPAVAFTFDLNNALQQCQPYTFSGYNGAVQPVIITGLIPLGESFLVYPPVNQGASYSWTADVAAGTSILFLMTDANGRQGGSSDLLPVQLSSDSSCLNASSPSSTASSPPSSTSTTSSPSTTNGSSTSTSIGAIAGTVIGCLVALAALITLGLFFLRRRRTSRSPFIIPTKRNSRRLQSVDLDHDHHDFATVPPINPFPYHADSPPIHSFPYADSTSRFPPSPRSDTALQPPQNYDADPFNVPPSPLHQHSRVSSNTDSFAGYGDVGSSSMSSAGRRKAAMAGATAYKAPTRFVLHTDVDDVVPDENGVVELPPQYSERRAAPPPQPPSVSHDDEFEGLAYASSSQPSSAGPYSAESSSHRPPLS